MHINNTKLTQELKLNLLTQKGLGVSFAVKTTKNAVFIKGSPEKSSKRHYILTVKSGAKSYSAQCIGKREVFSRAWTILQVHFPKAYEKATAIRKAQIADNRAKAKASRRAKKAAAGGIDARELINLFRQGKGVKKGNGKIVTLFL